MLRLTLRFEDQVRRYALPREESSLGADKGCDLIAPFPGISRRHANLRRLDGGVLVTDLGSKNGLVRDGARLAEILLRPRESVKIGRALLELEEVDSSDAAVAISMAQAYRQGHSHESETASMREASGAGSPTAALSLIRRVELAKDIDPARPEETRRILEAAARALECSAIWIWAGRDGVPAILSLSGNLPEDADLAEVAKLAVSTTSNAAAPTATSFALVSPLRLPRPAMAAILPKELSGVATWKLDLFDYLASKVRSASKSSRPRDDSRVSGVLQALKLPDEFIRGGSPAMTKLLEHLSTASRSRLDVLLLGETGTGKELVARTIHLSGSTAAGPFLAINCAAIPSELLEAQLFGVEARVATGVDPRPGLFLKASGGSLFLDEVGDLPEPLQAKLLRALQEREVLPLGATSPRRIDVRVISASNKDIPGLARVGRFRADLFYRLRGLQFHLPPLRDRREDIPALTAAFVGRSALKHGKSIAGVSQKALRLLMSYEWPGNIREFQNEIERAVLYCPDGSSLESQHFGTIVWALSRGETPALNLGATPSDPREEPPGPFPSGSGVSTGSHSEPLPVTQLSELIARTERLAIAQALELSGGNKSAAARALGISRAGLLLKLRRLQLL